MEEMESLRGLEEAVRQKVASDAERLDAERIEATRLMESEKWLLSQVREMEGPDLAVRAAAAVRPYDALLASPGWERLDAVTRALFGRLPRLQGLRFEEQHGVAVEVSRSGAGLGRSVDDWQYAWCMGSGLLLKRRLWTKYYGVREETVARFDAVEALGSVSYRRGLGLRERFAVGLSAQTFLTLLESGELFGRLVEDARRELASRQR